MDYLAFSGPFLLTVGGGVTLIFAFKAWQMRRRIEDIPKSKVRSIAMGLVEVEGVARGDRTVSAPLSGKDCFLYEYRIEKLMNEDEEGNEQYRTVSSGMDSVDFYVEDGTGKVRVDPSGAVFRLAVTTTDYSHSSKEPSARIKGFLKKAGVDYKGLLVNKRMRYTESLIVPGGNIYVMGSAMHDKKVKQGPDRVFIGQGETEPFFLIGNQSEGSMTAHYTVKMICFGAIGAFLSFLGIIMALGVAKGTGV